MCTQPQTSSKTLIILLFFVCLFNLLASAQSNDPYTPKIIPPSPNAASLGKFGDMPVSTYTGTTDVSVPVYTISAKGISIPVSLSYHTGGIRLAEESGWVGLGWALNAGGMISRSINDKDDFLGGYFNSSMGGFPLMPEVKGMLQSRVLYPGEPFLGRWGYVFTCRYNVYTELGMQNFWNAFSALTTAPSVYDMEPDTYSFNFLGRSGKFIIGRDGKVVLQKQENLKIQYAADGSQFTITDEQGNNYYFLDLEYNKPTTGGAQHISSWMLSKVLTQEKDSVVFNYFTDNTWNTTKGIAHESMRMGSSGNEGTFYSNDAGQDYLNKTLQSIDYSNAQIQFSFDASRTDLQGGKKLNTIKIYSKDATGLKYLKETQLFYSYFSPGGADPLEFTRLRLDSVREASGASTLPPYSFTYNMPASMQNFLGKHYSSVDHWGYFNGKSNAVAGNNKLGFIPPYLGIVTIKGALQTTQVLMDLAGANREPDESYMDAFSLNKVKYPTGGFTILNYEPNDYDHYKSISGTGGRDYVHSTTVTKTAQFIINTNGNSSGTVDLSNIFYTCPNDVFTGVPVGQNGTLSVAFRAASSDSLNKYHNALGYGKINFTFQSNVVDISNSSLNCNGTVTGGNCSGTVYSYSAPLTIGTKSVYPWSAYIAPQVKIPGGLQDIFVTFTWKEALFDNVPKLVGGGLRIQSITDYNENGKIAKKRTYDYGYKEDRDGNGVMETYSYGRLMGYLSYERDELIDKSGGALASNFTRYSSSNTSTTSQSSGNIIGYDQVTEYTVDSATNADAGKTVYTYNNSSDTTFSYSGYRLPGVTNLGNNLNGTLKGKYVFARVGSLYKPISSTEYYYRGANRIIYDAMKYQYFANCLPGSVSVITCYTSGIQACNCPQQIDSTGALIIANFSPAISSERILLDSTIEKNFDQIDTNLQLVNVTRNYYDNPKHYQLTRSRRSDSKNNTLVTFTKYPQDYISGSGSLTGNTLLDSLINKNMLGNTIEKRDSFYYSGSSTGYVNGSQLSLVKLLANKSIAVDKQYNLDLQSPVTDFQGYAVTNNLTTQDSRYRQMISFDSFDTDHNILQYTGTDQLPVSVIWDYQDNYPVAQTKNAVLAQTAFSSFEADGKGNWTYTGTAAADVTSPTGNNCYNLGQASGNITKTGLTSATTYIISYWRKLATPLSITGTIAGFPVQGKTVDGWTYFEHRVTGVTSVTVSGTGFIDELRLYPLNAQMTTYTYSPLVGVTSICDANNKISYYLYDEFLRVKWIKDQNKNILKTYRYHYLGKGPQN